ncbi:hypothetical protein D3C75_691210 [compost metagenome]
MLNGCQSLRLIHPPEQIVDILKMIVEGLAVDVAGLHQILHRDFIQRLGLHHLLQGIGQCLFCKSRHEACTSLSIIFNLDNQRLLSEFWTPAALCL